ncbi:MAG: indolepyruvate ferredoxin oxidoreductase subunit alpha [Chlorobium sp.]
MADPVKKPDISSVPAAKIPPAAPKLPPKASGAPASVAKEGKPKPKEVSQDKKGKLRLESLNVNLGRCGLPQESAFPVQKAAPKAAPKPAGGAKPAPGVKPAGSKPAPVAKAAPVAKSASGATISEAENASVADQAKPALKKVTPRVKSHYFIIENLCVGCGMCLDTCPPKVNAIGYKFYGDVQEGGFRCYIDQDACISCAACFSSDECPSGALIEVLPDGEVLDFTYTPPERLDFDLRFLHRFHREAN